MFTCDKVESKSFVNAFQKKTDLACIPETNQKRGKKKTDERMRVPKQDNFIKKLLIE